MKIIIILRLPPFAQNKKGPISDNLVSSQLNHLAITVGNVVPNYRNIE